MKSFYYEENGYPVRPGEFLFQGYIIRVTDNVGNNFSHFKLPNRDGFYVEFGYYETMPRYDTINCTIDFG